MATTEEMLAIALDYRPHAACLVPEKREERTTEGGLDVARLHNQVAPFVDKLASAGIRVSLFIEPSRIQVAVAQAMGAPVVELHTGRYVELVFAGDRAGAEAELERLREAAADGAARGLEVHVGHGLTYDTVGPVAAIPEVRELNIGHFIMGEALFVGLGEAVRRMREEIDSARGGS
jgi:pyridoxine 5-phosphate synthase